MEPPEISLPPGDQKIVFVSRFDTTQLSFSKEKVSELYRDSYISFIKGLEAGFKTNQQLTLVVSDTVVAGNWFTTDTPDFNDASHVPLLISRLEPDYLLTLDAFHLEIQQDQQLRDFGDGGVARYTEYYLVGSAALALFNDAAQVVDKMLMTDEALGNQSEAVPLSYDLGFDYALMFDEIKYKEERYMYSGKIFKDVIESAKKGNWEEAKKLLLPYTQDPKENYANQAASNMGVIEEAMGNKNAAMIWYSKSGSYMINEIYPQ